MEPAVVVPLAPVGGRELDVGDGLAGAVVEDRGAHTFGFVESVDCLHEGVVARVTDRSDGRGNLLQCEVLGQHNRRVLGSRVGVVNELPRPLPVAFPDAIRSEITTRSTCLLVCAC